MKRLSVSIVNWNTREQLRRCLQALETALRGLDAEVFVADNASADGSAHMVAEEFADVRLLALPTNVGFAAGNNAALAEATGEYLLILNPDVVVERSALLQLLGFLDERAEAVAVAPLLVGEDGEVHAHLYRRFPTLAQILLFWTVLVKISSRVPSLRTRYMEHDLRTGDGIPVDQIPGAAMLVRASAWREVGAMDPDYFIWFEDVDWCYRARQAGFSLYVLPAARMTHEGGASFGLWSQQTRLFQFYRTFFRFLCKHRLDSLRRVAVPVLTADLFLKEWKHRLASLRTGKDHMGVQTLRPTRRAIREVVRRHEAGELVAFSSAEPDEAVVGKW